MLPPEIKIRIESCLSENLNQAVVVNSYQAVSGGCINNALKLKTTFGEYFLKWNLDSNQKMFEAEHKSLQILKKTHAFYIPELICFDDDFLITEFVISTNKSKNFWKNFGRNLAKLHKKSNTKFGLSFDNYIGSLPQQNTFENNWITFFIQHRLKTQLKIGGLSSKVFADFEELFVKLPDLFPNEKPSLLHGDLWNGNFLIKTNDTPVLIDPAIYYGNREMDIAMSKLFGGFSSDFYDSYNEVFPLETEWEERVKLCNLYPLLVHVNLFGGGYLNQVKNILSYYVG